MSEDQHIVKVQLPLNKGATLALVYAKGREMAEQMDLPQKTLDRLNGDVKAFFHAVRVDGHWKLKARAPWQEW